MSKRAGVVPVVDGNLEEFQNAPSTTLGDHTLYALWEADALWLAAHIVDDRLDVSIATRDGDLWTEDSLEVFIDPERDRGSRMTGGDRQFVVNARGTQLDTDGAGIAWDGEWRAAVSPTAAYGSRTSGESDFLSFHRPSNQAGASASVTGTFSTKPRD